ncbi:GNAT family N-acetyltransferase [Streptomyces sp. NPDC005407]|uniref:GNAT family N-acetyltransferase n=1 Tax=Streptomyces sp. NPDC005407 TaxID=3155340 RepID=UPI0033B9C1CE
MTHPEIESGNPPAVYREARTIAEFVDAVRIRVNVFIVEQDCPPGWEPDDLDKESTQYVCIRDGRIVATGRLREDRPRSLKIERMAVCREMRGMGIGEGLTRFITERALECQPERIWMEAQAHLRMFYERTGFHAVSDEYDLFELGIQHVAMEYSPTFTTQAQQVAGSPR